MISERDPGHPNWVSTAGRAKGLIWLRWFLPDQTPAASGLSRGRRRRGRRDRGLRPTAITLTDLADPVFPEASLPMREGLAAYGAALT